MALLRRGMRILQKNGLKGFLRKGTDYLTGAFLANVSPEKDPRNHNWHLYIKDLDRRVEIMRASPWKLEIDSTSICNLQCVMCDHVFNHPRAGNHFNALLLERLGDFIPRAGEFQLMGCGEPLISPAFWKIMETIGALPSRKNNQIEISSNGAAMTSYITEKLLRSPLKRISFSLDAATASTYRKIRGADFGRTLENIRHLLKRRNESGKNLHVMLNMTLMRENISELPEFVELAHDLGADSIQFWPLHNYGDKGHDSWTVNRDGWRFNYREQMLGRDVDDAACANALIDMAVELAGRYALPIVWPMDSEVRISAPPPPEVSVADGFVETADTEVAESMETTDEVELDCVAPWEWMLTHINGDVRPCCYISKPFGNLGHSTAWDIWNGPNYREMRRSLANGKLPPQCLGAACKYARGRRYYLNFNK